MIQYSKSDGVCILRLDDPPLNAIGFELLDELGAAVDRANADFVVNRLFIPYLKEAFRLPEDGADPACRRRGDGRVRLCHGTADAHQHGWDRHSGIYLQADVQGFFDTRTALTDRNAAYRAGQSRTEDGRWGLQILRR
ncbi:MAG: hypothetical protein ACYS14_05395 [Planctomycetota bacterium]